jgi:hypothetical protein
MTEVGEDPGPAREPDRDKALMTTTAFVGSNHYFGSVPQS